jgi:hypothetical protein
VFQEVCCAVGFVGFGPAPGINPDADRRSLSPR